MKSIFPNSPYLSLYMNSILRSDHLADPVENMIA